MTTSQILSLEACVQLRQQMSQNGQTLVMTNGVFDLLHIGHLDYLEKARRLGDGLLVALNDDASTRAYKGAGRPLVPAEERARLLLALEPVQAVTLFPDATADRLLKSDSAADIRQRRRLHPADPAGIPDRHGLRRSGCPD